MTFAHWNRVLIVFLAISQFTFGTTDYSMDDQSKPHAKLDEVQAVAIAEQAIANLKPGTKFVLRPRPKEYDFGWVFRFTTERYAQSGNPKDMVPGTGPLIVLRENGKTQFLRTSTAPDLAIKQFEENWRKQHHQ